MADETSLAFEHPLARAVASATSETPDRISVRDYVKSVEIGAFQSERGVTQRLRFNVVLEVGPSTAAFDDDVDKVISYDTIVEAIETQLTVERINLLETFAERVAERCLADPRAIRAFVRIEKLDRIPGALGVEIMRLRTSEHDTALLRQVEPTAVAEVETASPVLILLPNAVIESERLGDWLDAIDALSVPAIIALEMLPIELPTEDKWARRRIALLAVEQNAWRLAALDRRCVVVSSRTELDHAAKSGHMSVWAPSKIVLDAAHRPQETAEDPAGLALWFMSEIGAARLVSVGAGGDARLEAQIELSAERPDLLASELAG